jgi:hypothetical protein
MFIHGAKISRSDVSAIAYKQTRSPRPWTMKRSNSHQVQAVVGALGVAVAAMRFYQVRELLAALLIFSLIFCIVGMALLILILNPKGYSQGRDSHRGARGLRLRGAFGRIEQAGQGSSV